MAMDCSALIAQVPLSPPRPVPALPAIYIHLLPTAYLQQESRHLPTPDSLDLPPPPTGVVAPPKTLRISGKNPGSCFALDAHRIKNPVSPNRIFYRGKCTGVCQYLHKDLQRIICTELIPVV